MKKKVFFIIGGVLLLCLVAGICLYAIPCEHKSLNTTLQATKLDKDGNILGTEEIAMQGIFMDYRFKEDTVELHVAPFGIFKSITFSGDSIWNSQSELTEPFDEFYEVTFGTWNTAKDDYDFGTIVVSKDFEYWVFRATDGNNQPIYYVASFSGEHTVAEIVQYFKGLAPGYVSDTNTTINN